MVETDVNGLCDACAPYFYLNLPSDLKELEQIIRAIERINWKDAALERICEAEEILARIRPYAEAGLADLPRPLPELESWLAEQKEFWENEQ